MKDFRVAVVQMNCLLGANAENMDRHAEYVARAADEGADLVMFPEQSISGHWAEAGSNAAAESVPDGPSMQRLIELAANHGLFIAAGIGESAAGAVYNSFVIVGPEGFVGLQRKVHPSGDEYFFYRAGGGFDVFDLPFARVGVNICADGGYSESARVVALKGAEVLLCPNAARCGAAPADVEEERNRVAKVKAHRKLIDRVRARDNGMFVIVNDQVGVAGKIARASGFTGTADVVHAGGVLIVKPDAEVQAESRTDRFEEEMVVADLKAADLMKTRGRQCFNLTNRRPGAYGIIADPDV